MHGHHHLRQRPYLRWRGELSRGCHLCRYTDLSRQCDLPIGKYLFRLRDLHGDHHMCRYTDVRHSGDLPWVSNVQRYDHM